MTPSPQQSQFTITLVRWPFFSKTLKIGGHSSHLRDPGNSPLPALFSTQKPGNSQTHVSVCYSTRLQELKTPRIQVNDCVALRPGQLGFLTVSYVCDIIADFMIYPLSTTLSSPGISVRNLLESSGRQVHCSSIFPLFSRCNPWLCQLVAPLASSCITIMLCHQATDLLFF